MKHGVVVSDHAFNEDRLGIHADSEASVHGSAHGILTVQCIQFPVHGSNPDRKDIMPLEQKVCQRYEQAAHFRITDGFPCIVVGSGALCH